jgi:hypothetical protein
MTPPGRRRATRPRALGGSPTVIPTRSPESSPEPFGLGLPGRGRTTLPLGRQPVGPRDEPPRARSGPCRADSTVGWGSTPGGPRGEAMSSHTSVSSAARRAIAEDQPGLLRQGRGGPALPWRRVSLAGQAPRMVHAAAWRRADLVARFFEGIGDRVLEAKCVPFASSGVPCFGPAPCAGGLEEGRVEPCLDGFERLAIAVRG